MRGLPLNHQLRFFAPVESATTEFTRINHVSRRLVNPLVHPSLVHLRPDPRDSRHVFFFSSSLSPLFLALLHLSRRNATTSRRSYDIRMSVMR